MLDVSKRPTFHIQTVKLSKTSTKFYIDFRLFKNPDYYYKISKNPMFKYFLKGKNYLDFVPKILGALRFDKLVI